MAPSRAGTPRHRAPWWLQIPTHPRVLRRYALVAALAVLLAWGLSHQMAGAARARRAWGDTRPVLITSRPVAAGQAVGPAAALVSWPVGLVPQQALTVLPSRARARSALTVGTPITRAVIAPHAVAGRAARPLVAVPRGSVPLPLRPGTRVEVWATSDPSMAPERQHLTSRVVRHAVVRSITDRTVVLAVRPADVGPLTDAVALATVTLVASGR